MIQFKENARTDGRKDGRKAWQTLFYKTLPATARRPKKIDVTLILSIIAKEKFDPIANLEKLFWFLTKLIAFVIAHIVSMMRAGFSMANTWVHK